MGKKLDWVVRETSDPRISLVAAGISVLIGLGASIPFLFPEEERTLEQSDASLPTLSEIVVNPSNYDCVELATYDLGTQWEGFYGLNLHGGLQVPVEVYSVSHQKVQRPIPLFLSEGRAPSGIERVCVGYNQNLGGVYLYGDLLNQEIEAKQASLFSFE